MSHYETTVRLTHISTSSKARSGLSVADAVGATKAHLRYITRDDAAQPGDVIARSNRVILDGSPDDLKAAAREAIDKRSQRHTDAYGVRLADRLIVSLPRDATMDEQRTMCAAILADFTADSEAFGMAAIPRTSAGTPTRISCSWMVSNPSPPPRPPPRRAARPQGRRLAPERGRQSAGGARAYRRHHQRRSSPSRPQAGRGAQFQGTRHRPRATAPRGAAGGRQTRPRA